MTDAKKRSKMANYIKITSSLFLLCIVKLVTSQESCSEMSEYYVSSRTGTDSEGCLRPGQRDHPCASLAYLTDNINKCASMEIMDNLTLNNTVIRFKSSYNVQLFGTIKPNHVALYCEGKSGIRIDGVANFSLENFYIIGCAFGVHDYEISPYPHNKMVYTSILVIDATEVLISNCSFHNHSSYSILLTEVYGNTNIEKCRFVGNRVTDSEEVPRVRGIVIRLNKPRADSFIKISSCFFESNINKNLNYSTCYDLTKNSVPQNDGGAVNIIRWSNPISLQNLTITFDNCLFASNEATNGGAISVYFYNYAYMTIINTKFLSNKALCQGGAVFFLFTDNRRRNSTGYYHSEFEIVGSRFEYNSAYSGGAVKVRAGVLCGDSCYHDYVNVIDTYWINNTASGEGFAMSLEGPNVKSTDGFDEYFLTLTISNCHFMDNWSSNNSRGALYAENSLLIFMRDSLINFTNNTGTALVLLNSHSVLESNLTFIATGNSGTLGGVVFLEGNSDIEICPESNNSFVDNSAAILGGAIYSKVYSRCTFSNISTNTTLSFFKNNSAGVLEQAIYIESIGVCGELNKAYLTSFEYFSSAESVILFPLYSFNVTLQPSNYELMLGQIFHLIPFNITDIFGRTTMGMAYLNIQSVGSYKIVGPKAISIDNYTQDIEFMIVGPYVDKNESLDVELFFDRHAPYGVDKIEIHIILVPCRLGYEYSITSGICVCDNISHHNTLCFPNSQSICVKRRYWFSQEDKAVYLCPTQNCIFLGEHCPSTSGYCFQCPSTSGDCTNSTEYCHMNSQDEFCQRGRSRFLCSECASNYSFTFAGLQCTSSSSCSIKSTVILLLLLLGYWISISIIFLCLSLKCNIGSGYLYGLIHFFSVATIYTGNNELFDKMWIQIMMGIGNAIMTLDPKLIGYADICFAEKWVNPLSHEIFRIATPLAVVLIVSCLMAISHCCKRLWKLSSSANSVIHATFLLILFMHTSVSYMSFKVLAPMKVKEKLVVQVAPSVPYFGKEHMPYAIVAILAETLLSLPVCFILLFSPFIMKHINLSKYKMKNLLLEFQACYKPENSWFAGFYFTARQVIFFVCAILSGPFPNYNNVLTTVNILVLIIHVSVQPYSKNWLNILDAFLLTDIIILSLLTPVKRSINNPINKFFFNIVIPYTLILLPTIILFGGLIIVTLRKLLIVCKINLYKRVHGPSINIQKTLYPPYKPTSEYFGDKFNHTYREPLLEDMDSEMFKEASRSYGSLSQNRN